MKFGGSAISRSATALGSRPAATTSRTSVFRVTTPSRRPSSSVTKIARTSPLSAKQRPASCALAPAASVVGSGTIASRTVSGLIVRILAIYG